MPRTQYYVAGSVDGYIADADDSLEWLFTAHSDEGGPPNYAGFIAAVGAIVLGSHTYEWIMDHGARSGSGGVTWPYDVPSWVLTTRDLPPAVSRAPLIFTSDAVTAVHGQATVAAGDRNVWVMGGGEVAGQFADAGLLDDLILAVAPVTLGAGAPLLPRNLDLGLAEVTRNGDFACLRYTVGRPER